MHVTCLSTSWFNIPKAQEQFKALNLGPIIYPRDNVLIQLE